jgi:hypothetical protein
MSPVEPLRIQATDAQILKHGALLAAAAIRQQRRIFSKVYGNAAEERKREGRGGVADRVRYDSP